MDYKTARWQKLRMAILARDLFTCQMCGAILRQGRSDSKQSALRPAVVDHIIPHRGVEALFWHPANLWAVCCDCHDSTCQQIETRHKGQLTPRAAMQIRDAKLRYRVVGIDGYSLTPPQRAVTNEAGWREIPAILSR